MSAFFCLKCKVFPNSTPAVFFDNQTPVVPQCVPSLVSYQCELTRANGTGNKKQRRWEAQLVPVYCYCPASVWITVSHIGQKRLLNAPNLGYVENNCTTVASIIIPACQTSLKLYRISGKCLCVASLTVVLSSQYFGGDVIGGTAESARCVSWSQALLQK